MNPDSRLKRLSLTTASIFLLIVGVLLGVQQMYLMAVSLSLIPLVFWSIGLLMQRGVECSRVVPSTCGRGERIKIELVLHNKSMFPLFYVRATDRLPRWMRFDGVVGEDSSMILHLARNESAKLAYYVRAYKRGRQSIGPTKVNTPDLMGISSYSRLVNDSDQLLVLPEVVPVGAEFFSGGASKGWRDQENASTRGVGSDFQGVREYVTGDDLRRVNWKTTARTGSLAVTEYAVGYANDMTIALDLSTDCYGRDDIAVDSALETAIAIAASVAAAGLKQGSSVKIVTNGNLHGLPDTLTGEADLVALLTALALTEADAGRPLAESVHRYALTNNQDRSFIAVTGLSPFDPGLTDALEDMRRHNGSDPLVFWIDTKSFQDGKSSLFEGGDDRRRAGIAFESSVGRNIVVKPQMNLRELLSSVAL